MSSGGQERKGRSARRIQQISLEQELGLSFARYAEKVILDRAIPDIRDGLKPVQRRIVFAMYDAGNTADKPYRKAAKTVGDVMGNYHPHGDASIYDALVRLAQPWKLRYPLVDGHGNFGSMDDDPAAAMRYTEARLSPIAAELLGDIGKETVPWQPNFDEKIQEPVVLPAGFLNLLMNGCSGVSAGFATEIPSHNLTEVVGACLALLVDPEIDLDGLMEHVRGPDFPTGGVLMGLHGLREAYSGGRGKVVLRGRYTIERQRDGKHLIVFTEIPYHVVKSDLVRQMDALRLDKSVQGVLDVRDESDREGLRVVIEVSRSADPAGVVAFFLKKTDLQRNYHFNMVSIWKKTPYQVGLLDIVRAFVNHRRDVVRRRSDYDLARASTRLHEVDGLIKAVDILDEVIATIRASRDRADARSNLEPLGFTAEQADAILDLRLVRLTNLQLLQLREEAKVLKDEIERLEGILGDASVCDAVVTEELERLRDKYGDERRTTIQEAVERLDVSLEVTVKVQDVVVAVTNQGWIKRSSMASFSATGADRASSGVRPGDVTEHVVHTNTRHRVLVFTDRGQCYPVLVHQIPEARWGDVGTALVNVCGIESGEQVVAVHSFREFKGTDSMLVATARGSVKLTAVVDFDSSRSKGFVAMKLAQDDRVVAVERTDQTGDVILLTRQGRGIRFDLAQVSQQGRAAGGVRGMGLDPTDEICAMTLAPADDEDRRVQVAVFTEQGAMKRTPLAEHPRQRRGGKGVSLIFQRAKSPHRCIAVCTADRKTRFEVVDSEGHEHLLEGEAIPSTVRDGRGHNPVKLQPGVRLLAVGTLPDLPPEEEILEGPDQEGGETLEAQVPPGPGDEAPQADVTITSPEASEKSASAPLDETPAEAEPGLQVDDSGQGLLLDLVPPGGKDDEV